MAMKRRFPSNSGCHASAAFHYARAASPRLRRKLGQALGVGPEQIVIGNGSDEIIDLLLRVVPQPGRDNVVLFRPSPVGTVTTSGLRKSVQFIPVRIS